MKRKTVLFTLFALFLLIGGVGCANKIDKSDCYIGEVITLFGVGHERYNIVTITKVPNKHSLPVGTTIAFDIERYGKKVEIGNIIDFEILMYEKWVGPATADHLWPGYVGVIKSCKE